MKPSATQSAYCFLRYAWQLINLTFSQSSNSVKSIKKTFIAIGTLSGKVVEKGKGSVLPGATVYIPDLKLGVIADANGQYHFNSLPSGAYLVEVHYVGFKTVIKNVDHQWEYCRKL